MPWENFRAMRVSVRTSGEAATTRPRPVHELSHDLGRATASEGALGHGLGVDEGTG